MNTKFLLNHVTLTSCYGANRTIKTIAKMVAVSTLLALAGCVTMGGGLSQAQCTQGDWRAIGYQDGLMGRDTHYINRYAKNCAAATTATNRRLWEQGRAEGLTRYCTPLRAYQLGREGIDYNNVCPQAQMLDLIKAHDEGYYNYQREQSLNQLWYNDPFYSDPFWDSRFGGRWYHPRPLYAPTPNPVPDYVPQTDSQTKTKSNDPITKDGSVKP